MSAKRATHPARTTKSTGLATTARAGKRKKASATAKATTKATTKATRAAKSGRPAQHVRGQKPALVEQQVARAAEPRARRKPEVRLRVVEIARPARTGPSREGLATVVGLAGGTKRVDLRLSVPVTGQRATIEGIGLDPVEARPRQAFYFDTLDLALNRVGLLVRAHRIRGGRADAVVKLRCHDLSAIGPDLRASEALRLEVDSVDEGFACSASFKADCKDQAVLDVVAGVAPVRSLFSTEQCALFDAHAHGITMDRLAILGPIFLLKAKLRPKGLDRRLGAELWHDPDGSRVLELSTKCAPEECSAVSAELRTYLASCGLTASSDQVIRTKAALELLSAGLR